MDFIPQYSIDATTPTGLLLHDWANRTMRESALWLYQSLTLRTRKKRLESLRLQGRSPIAILFYHRVADTSPNDWTLPCADFVRHLDWLQDNYDVVSLAEAQRRIGSPSCDRPTVALTFDDGYGDNADFAIPELVRRGLTCTYFVSTRFVETGEPFPHDVEVGVPLRPNTIAELREFSNMGIELGAHTRNHPDLGRLSDREVEHEICSSIDDLEQWLGEAVRYFAFPFGLPQSTSQHGVDTIAARGLQGFCTAYGALNWPGSSGFHLRRLHADPGLQRLKNWLTLDPRKLIDRHVLPFNDSPLALLEPT